MQNLSQSIDFLAYLTKVSDQLIPIPGITASGGAGSDTFVGFSGNDRYFGKGGADVIFGGAGSDQLYGGTGNDLMVGGAGNDVISGGSGVDTLSYSGTPAGGVVVRLDLGTATGSAGADRLSGFENVIGSAGADRIVGTSENNILVGADGDDLLFGGASYDSLLGQSGIDRLFGDAGNDILAGGAGADFVIGGAGSDVLFGGTDADQFVFGVINDLGGADRIGDFQVGLDKLVIGQLPGGGPGTLPVISFAANADGTTQVSVDQGGVTLFDITVLSLGGTISQSDIVFSFNG
jgi:Ca2+-binding RTX toxin-like protein